MDNTKRAADLDNKEHGVHKDKHINQYGDQNKDSSQPKRDAGETNKAGGNTLSNKENAVQDNAHKDAKQKSKQ
ncbi:hypothetical protein [uncultured Dokdonia sp.]|jgi:hypothetical protein|uniref:hypothetical protein n=1 Tax=Dokdonia sp. R78006 TaxID=3093866 RepID=UPI00261B3690|nr:hypothetical protein [uncultured Dokdonia sp.]